MQMKLWGVILSADTHTYCIHIAFGSVVSSIELRFKPVNQTLTEPTLQDHSTLITSERRVSVPFLYVWCRWCEASALLQHTRPLLQTLWHLATSKAELAAADLQPHT